MPDYACLIVGANMGIVGMCKEHMGVALALKVRAWRGLGARVVEERMGAWRRRSAAPDRSSAP